MFWHKKVKNIVPDDYEFSKEYEITVTYEPEYWEERPWRAVITGWAGSNRARTKEEVITITQNDIYNAELKKRALEDNPSETFTIPPIRKFQ
jgi:hypothetical protein